MSISSRITSIEEHIENAYDKIADLGIDLTNVDKNINNIATKLEQVYEEYPKVTASNVTEASLNGTKKGRMEIDIKGNTTQESKLPEGYTQLDYIESTGTQYIDTGYTPVQGDNFEFKNVTSNVSENLGTLFSAGTEDYQLVFLINESGKTSFYKYFATDAAQSFITPTINKSNIKIVNGGLYIDGTLKSTSTYAGTVNTTLYLGRRANTASPLNGSFGEVIITNGGTIKRDLIPCKNSSNVIGMYDLVTKTFLTNSGTGTFTAGNEAPCPDCAIPIKSCGDNVNLFKTRQSDYETNGITFTLNADGTSVTANGRATADAYFPLNNVTPFLKTGKNYCLSCTSNGNVQTSSSTYRAQVAYVYSNTTKYQRSDGTFVYAPDGTETAYHFALVIFNGMVCDNLVLYPKLEQGTQATPYSPYGCGNVNVKVQNKNLAILELGDLNYSTGLPSDSNSVIRTKNSIPLKNGDKIGYVTNLTNAVGIRRYNKAGVFLGFSTFSNVTHTFTNSSGETVYIRVRCALSTGETLDTAQLQIEYGDPTTYVAHQEQNLSFPLAQGQKLMEGDYLADDGVHHVMKQDTVNGTTATFNDAKENGKYYCNQKVTGYLTGQTITFDTSVTNAIVQYQLAEEVIETYTQEQQTAYNQIKQAYSYLNQTNISSPDEVKPNMNLSALKGT